MLGYCLLIGPEECCKNKIIHKKANFWDCHRHIEEEKVAVVQTCAQQKRATDQEDARKEKKQWNIRRLMEGHNQQRLPEMKHTGGGGKGQNQIEMLGRSWSPAENHT